MSNTRALTDQQQRFASYVSECRFFTADGTLDLEMFCVHLRLSLYCDGAGMPDATELYVLMLKLIAQAKGKVERKYIRKEAVADWNDGLLAYYPDKQRTRVHFNALNVLYPIWIREAGEQLLGHENPEGKKGRFWVGPSWRFTTLYLSRFEAELVRVGGLARILEGDGSGRH